MQSKLRQNVGKKWREKTCSGPLCRQRVTSHGEQAPWLQSLPHRGYRRLTFEPNFKCERALIEQHR